MSELVRYRIPLTTIDGHAFAPGTEVELKALAVVETDRIVGEEGDAAPILQLRICDWTGPRLEPHNPSLPESRQRRAERAIVRALLDAGFERQSQVTREDGFEIVVGGLRVRVDALLEDGAS